MHRIMLITEDARGLTALQSTLVREGCRVSVSAPDEDSLLEAVGESTPEVIVVDSRANPGAASESRRLLATECNLKEFLVITLFTKEQASEADWTGIDEFLVEPFDGEELSARLRLLFWRTRKMDSDQVIKADNLMIDLMNYEVLVDGVPVTLTFKEYELLRFLATHRGRVFTREALLDHVWGYDYYGGTRTVDVHIRRLRAKLSPDSESIIETVRNVGYRFAA